MATVLQRHRDGLLWLGVLAGPLALLADVGVSYALVEARAAGRLPLLGITLLAGAVATAGATVSLRLRGGLSEDVDAERPARFLATSGALLSAFALLVIVAVALPKLAGWG